MSFDPTASGYKIPSADIVQILDTPPSPSGFLTPDRKTLLLADYEAYPPLTTLARPFLKLAGLRIDPVINGTQRTSQYTGFTLVDTETGEQTSVAGIPDGSRLGSPVWTCDSSRFAFTRDTDTGIEIGICEREAGAVRFLPDLVVSDILAGPFQWSDDARTLLVARIPSGRGSLPELPIVPDSPVIEETSGKFTKASTFQDLLRSDFDTAQFRHLTTVQLAFVDIDTGAITPLRTPDAFIGVAWSPDERYLAVSRLTDVSFRVPYHLFGKIVEIWDTHTGTVLHTLADLPVRDEIPQQGVATGPRNVAWQGNHDATLLWVEALDGGDPLAKVPHRDAIFTLPAPFTDAPREVLRLQERYAGWDWLPTPDDVLLTEYSRDRRWRTTYRLNLSEPEPERNLLFDLSVNDAYNSPGNPVYITEPDGRHHILQDGNAIYLSGRGSTPDGDRPFLRRMDLTTRETEELWRCSGDGYEGFISFLDGSVSRLLTSYQNSIQPANFFRLDLQTGKREPITHFADPHPQITGLQKELVTYKRTADDVPLSGALYLPPDYDVASGKKLPLIFWAYPEEYSDASTAGQVRGSDKTFTRLAGTSPLWFVTQGFAVLLDATVPVVGDPETMNDTFVEQIVGSAKAAIDFLDERGIIDRDRVVCAGHSYGAFMTANLLAHSDLFAAGIARSGAYNRTLTPFGFQSERRSYWEAPDIYRNLSPFTYADKIKAPLLLIHGQADNNSGTHTLQSERFYQALAAHGATARLVLLPHESHGYRARESVLHVLAECFEWVDRFVPEASSDGSG
ncbi:MAG: prolyl oligopeptidase family serine peptidase [Fibrella sp.]|nr:prolyl oligopeptidase family serine peptidase [Armatimonadota bacterium]